MANSNKGSETGGLIALFALIESQEAVENIDEISSIDGIDAITLGYQDLAQDLGVLGSDDQDRIIDEKRHQILSASKKYGGHFLGEKKPLRARWIGDPNFDSSTYVLLWRGNWHVTNNAHFYGQKSGMSPILMAQK